MDGVVAPVDHVFPDVAEEVSVTLPPWQKVVGPLAVITATGLGNTVIGCATVTGEVQIPLL